MISLKCENLFVGYDGKTVAGPFDFEIGSGEYLCVVGNNGSGKTTFMKTLLGLLPPVSGKIVFGNGRVHSGVGYLPQQTSVQRDFPATAKEIVLSGCAGKMFLSKADKRKAEFNMNRTGVLSLQNKCYRELSGGQQQRVLLARALCAANDIILLDEPVSGLDPTAAKEMYKIIKELNRGGMTVIMISHDMQSVSENASSILHVGDTVFFGSRDEYYRSFSENGGF